MAMNRQRRTANISNIFSYDDAGNIVIKDYGQVTRYSWNGLIHGFVGPVSVSSVSAATTDTDRFLVSDGGVLKYRTGVELLSDIGGVPSTRTLTINGTSYDLSADRSWTIAAGISGSGATGQVAYWNGTNSQTGSNNLFWDAANARLGIGTNSPANTLHLSDFNTTNSQFRIGSIEFQSYTLNNSWFSDNAYFDGANFRLRGAGQAILFYLTGSEGQFRFADLGSAGGIISNFGKTTFKTNTDGTFAVGSNMSNNQGVYTNAKLLVYGGTGNTLLNGTSDSGQRLQVYGDAFIKGSGATSATNALLVQNTNGTELLRIQNDGTTIARAIGNNNTTPIFAATQQNGNTRFSVNALGQTFIGGDANAATDTLLRIERNFNPTSGTTTHITTLLIPTINQTGGANGITRGLYVNPTLTAAADWRSIEWSNNSGWGLYGAGTANNFLGGNLTISRNQNAGTTLTINNTTSGTSAGTKIVFGNDGNNAACTIEKLSSTTTPYKFVASSDYAIYNGNISTNGDICIFNDRTAGIIKFGAGSSSTAQMTLTAAGRLLLGTTTEGTFLLDVNGTARVSGNTTISLNQNAETTLFITNTTSGSQSSSFVRTTSSNGFAIFGKLSATTTPYRINNSNDAVIYNASSGDISIFNDFPTGIIKFATNGDGTQVAAFTASGSFLVGTTTESSSARVRIDSTTKGFLPPRMTTTQKNAIATPAAGLQVYDTTLNAVSVYDGAAWVAIGGGSVSGTYTPTLAAVYNVTSFTAYELQYMRVGNVVTVGGYLQAIATAANTWTRISITLPISSTFDFSYRAGGGGGASATNNVCAIQAGAFGTSVVYLDSFPNTTSNLGYTFSFTYLII